MKYVLVLSLMMAFTAYSTDASAKCQAKVDSCSPACGEAMKTISVCQVNDKPDTCKTNLVRKAGAQCESCIIECSPEAH